MSELDLTPFGFTPTENAVYEALVQRGPSGGYQLSNVLGIARANVYQALRGLVAKDAAIQVGDRPSAFRAVRTDALFTRIANDQSVKLDLLERQLGDGSGEGEPSFVVLESERAVAQVITHHGARSPEPCIVVATGPILRSLQPVWRKRAADSQRTDLWSVGEPADLEVDLAGIVDPAAVVQVFGATAILFHMPQFGVVARTGELGTRGYWSDDVALIGPVRATILYLTTAGR